MDHGPTRRRFDELLAATGAPLGSLTPRAGLEIMVGLFESAPSGSELTASWRADMRSRLNEDGLELRLTLWVSLRPEHSGAAGVRTLTLAFQSGESSIKVGDDRLFFDDFPAWFRWCNDRADLPAFRASVEESPPFSQITKSNFLGVAWIDERHEFWSSPFAYRGHREPVDTTLTFTESQWLESNDARAMLSWFRRTWTGAEADLDRLLGRYYLACCRRIWRLLPQEWSRAGVEAGERRLDGHITPDEYSKAEYLAEGAAFNLDYDGEPEAIARWCREVSQIPLDELNALLHQPRTGFNRVPRGLLTHAAYFADHAMCSWSITPRDSVDRYAIFLSAPLLREIVGNPFR